MGVEYWFSKVPPLDIHFLGDFNWIKLKKADNIVSNPIQFVALAGKILYENLRFVLLGRKGP